MLRGRRAFGQPRGQLQMPGADRSLPRRVHPQLEKALQPLAGGIPAGKDTEQNSQERRMSSSLESQWESQIGTWRRLQAGESLRVRDLTDVTPRCKGLSSVQERLSFQQGILFISVYIECERLKRIILKGAQS